MINLKLGPSIPVGRFAHISFHDRPGSPHDTSGNAVPGLTGNIQLQYHLNKNWDISLQAGGSLHRQNVRELARSVRKTLPEDATVVASARQWKAIHIMAGAYYRIPISSNERLELQPGLSAGICNTAKPGHRVFYRYKIQGDPFTYDMSGAFSLGNQSLPWSFCYQADVAIKFHINKRLSLLLDLAYFDARLPYKYSYSAGQFPNDPLYWIPTKKQYALSAVNLQTGMSLKF